MAYMHCILLKFIAACVRFSDSFFSTKNRLQQGVYAKNDDKLILSGNIAKPPVSTPAYGMGGLSGAGMGLAAIGVGVAGFGAAAMPQIAPPSEADTFVMRDPELGGGPESPASNR